jgi:hypothetical protein
MNTGKLLSGIAAAALIASVAMPGTAMARNHDQNDHDGDRHSYQYRDHERYERRDDRGHDRRDHRRDERRYARRDHYRHPGRYRGGNHGHYRHYNRGNYYFCPTHSRWYPRNRWQVHYDRHHRHHGDVGYRIAYDSHYGWHLVLRLFD